MFNVESLFTVNCVIKLNPDACPTPPSICACQLPLVVD
jgi:hypothetical protein